MASKGMKLLLKLKAKTDSSMYQQLNKIKEKAEELAQTKRKLKKIEDAESNFEKLKGKYGKLLIQYRKNRQEITKLEKIKKTGTVLNSKQEEKLQRLIQRQMKLTESLNSQRKAYKINKKEVEANKNSLEQYKEQVRSLTKEITKLNAAEKISNKAKKIKSSVGNVVKKGVSFVGKTAIAGTAAGVAGGVLLGKAAASTYLEFNANMKKVQAISGATEEEYKRLEKEAMRLGATTKFTAAESAAAMEKMALAGFNTNQIIAGMPGVLDLAAAAGEDVAMVSDIITDNLNAFGMTAKDTGRMAEILAWGMSKTNVNIEMLGESFKYIARSAKPLGISLEDMVTTLGLMGDQAIKSGQAGTSLSAAFSKLIEKKDKLKRVGIEISDEKGNFLGIAKVVAQFEKVIKREKMTGVEQLQFLKNVFEEQGSRAFSLLLSAQKEINGVMYKGSAALEKTIQSAAKDSVGLATKMKNIMLEGASGTMTLFSSAWDGIKNALGKIVFSPAVIKILQKVTEIFSELANVLNGSFNDNKFNKFFKTFFEEANKMFSKLWGIIRPAREAIMSLFQGEGVDTENLKNIIYGLARAFNVIVIAAVELWKIINAIGVDNIVVFTGVAFGVIKLIKVVNLLIATFTTIKSVGGILSALKIAIGALGGPVTLVAGAIGLIGYYIYKNWDSSKGVLENFKNMFLNIKNAALEIVKSVMNIGETIIGASGMNIIKSFIMWIFEHSPVSIVLDFINAWDSSKGIVENLQNVFMAFIEKICFFSPIFSTIKLAIETVIELAIEFYKIWSGNLSLGDKIKAIFNNSFKIITNAVMKVIDSIRNLGNTIKELPIINTILKSIGIVSEEKTIVDGSHRNGLSNVPFDGYIAELHKNERVLTADENKEYSNGLFLDRFLSINKAASSNINNSKVEFVYNPNIDLKVNLASADSIDDLTTKFKKLQEDLYRDFMQKIKELERGNNERRLQF